MSTRSPTDATSRRIRRPASSTTLEGEWADGAARFATVCGRIYAMDRDRRWERTERYYRAVVDGIGAGAGTASEAVAASYRAASPTSSWSRP